MNTVELEKFCPPDLGSSSWWCWFLSLLVSMLLRFFGNGKNHPIGGEKRESLQKMPSIRNWKHVRLHVFRHSAITLCDNALSSLTRLLLSCLFAFSSSLFSIVLRSGHIESSFLSVICGKMNVIQNELWATKLRHREYYHVQKNGERGRDKIMGQIKDVGNGTKGHEFKTKNTSFTCEHLFNSLIWILAQQQKETHRAKKIPYILAFAVLFRFGNVLKWHAKWSLSVCNIYICWSEHILICRY